MTCKDAYPLPHVEKYQDALDNSCISSMLDLPSGYFQVAVSEDDQLKTAVTTPFGLFEWTHMPFGLCTAPATFQRLTEVVLGDQVFDTLLVYLDCIIVLSKDFDEHCEKLDVVFTRLRENNLTLKQSQCFLFKAKVKFLEHVISKEEVQVCREKVQTLEEWPFPKKAKEVGQVLTFLGYYRRFIPKFAHIARPLHGLMCKAGSSGKGKRSQVFSWSQEAFDTLRKALTSPPVLSYPDFSLPFTVATDGSFQDLGVVLSQKQSGVERVIAYASRGLKKSERNYQNYSAFKLELLDLKWAVTEKCEIICSTESSLILQTTIR